MDAMVNRVILMGNLGDNVKVHRFDKHSLLSHFRIESFCTCFVKPKNEA